VSNLLFMKKPKKCRYCTNEIKGNNKGLQDDICKTQDCLERYKLSCKKLYIVVINVIKFFNLLIILMLKNLKLLKRKMMIIIMILIYLILMLQIQKKKIKIIIKIIRN
jgi:hypothetical protein